MQPDPDLLERAPSDGSPPLKGESLASPSAWLAVCAVAGLALALRLWRVSAVSLRGDEAFSVLFSSQGLFEMLRQLRVTEPHPPLYYAGLHFWMRLAGEGELAVRLPSVVFGTLLVPLGYRLMRDVAPHRTALLASLLLAVNPFLIWHSQDARMYTLLPLLAAASYLFAARVLLGRGHPGKGRRALDYAGLVVANVLMLHTHYASAYALLAENVAAAWVAVAPLLARSAERGGQPEAPGNASTRRWLVGWLAAQAAIVALSFPWWLYAREVLLHRTVSWLGAPSLPALLYQEWTAFSLGAIANPRATLWLVAAFLPVLALGLATWLRRRAGQVLALFLGVPLLGAYVTSLGRAIFLDRYFIFVLPVYALALATGLSALRTRSRLLSALSLLAMLAATTDALGSYYLDPRAAKAPDWRSLGAAIVGRYEPGDVLVLNSPDPTPRYYVRLLGRDLGVPDVTLPASGPPNGPATEAALAKLDEQYRRVWLIPIRDPGWDADGLVEGWLDARARPLAEERVGGMKLRLYALPGGLLDAHPRAAPVSFGGAIQYLGADISRESAPGSPGEATVRPGEEVWLTLYFRAVRPVDGDYRVFNHLVDEADVLRGQHDGVPAGGHAPTASWRVGELVMDRHRIPVDAASPPGRYRIRTGLYDPTSGRRLPVVDGGGGVVGDSVVIEGVRIIGR